MRPVTLLPHARAVDFASVPDLTLYAIPFFLVTLVAEVLWMRRARAAGRDVIGYEDTRDTFASLGMGVGSLFIVTAVHYAQFVAAGWLFPHRLIDLGDGALAWAAAIVLWDFVYYWEHRFGHEVRLFWASHVNHHSSRAYNLSTALRQAWTPLLALVLFPLLALVGVSPARILVAEGVNLIYQYWVHTESIGRLPRALEWLFNTPSHHRVHHGSNPAYLDRNYGGIFIVWDRFFGTFAEERERVVYGLTKNVESYNLLVIAFHEYAAIGRDLRAARSVREAFFAVFGRPR